MSNETSPYAMGSSSLELLAAIASLPGDDITHSSANNSTSILDSKSAQTLTPQDVEHITTIPARPFSKDRVILNAARRIRRRIGLIRRKINTTRRRVSIDPIPITVLIQRVERDLSRILGKNVYRPVKLVEWRSNPSKSEAKVDRPDSFDNQKFFDQSTQTIDHVASPGSSLDIDALDPTVSISPDFGVSVTFGSQRAIDDDDDMVLRKDIEASGHLLDTFLEKVEKSAGIVVHSNSVTKAFDAKSQQLTPTFVNMFWNTFPALLSELGHVFVRLADISAVALPAKDSSLLKQRCNKLGILVHSCTDLQRNFLVKYCFGSPCRSIFMVDCNDAKTLLASYCQDKLKEHGLTIKDMQVVLLSEEESKRLISSRLNVCSTKYAEIGATNGGEATDGVVLRRRTIKATPPVVASKKRSAETKGSDDSSASKRNKITATVGDETSERHRLWSHAQVYNNSVSPDKKLNDLNSSVKTTDRTK